MENKTPKIISAKQIQRQFNFLKMVAALSIAVLIIMVVVFLIADEPLDALGHFFLGPFDSVRHLGNIIENAYRLNAASRNISKKSDLLDR